jgi:uncharacterized protein (DUF427 family)
VQDTRQDARREAIFRMWTERGGRVRLEPTERRIRVALGGVMVADSKRAELLYLPPPHNAYAFPREDVNWDLIKESNATDTVTGLGTTQLWSVEAGGKTAENAAWTVPQPPTGLSALAGSVMFRWNLMDAWYEEDDEVFVHPRDPKHRVDVLNSSRQVKVTIDGELVAETSRPRLLFETDLPVRYYIPRLDVRMDLLEPTDSISRCPYKGVASYWSVRAGERVHKDIAWSYKSPIPECPKIENLIAFYNERVDIEVDGHPVERPRTPWSVGSQG